MAAGRTVGVFAMQGKPHHKLMVIDETIVVAGSFSYTQPANDYNDENLFVLGSPFPTVDGITVNKANCQAIAVYLKAEIERIIAASVHTSPGISSLGCPALVARPAPRRSHGRNLTLPVPLRGCQ